MQRLGLAQTRNLAKAQHLVDDEPVLKTMLVETRGRTQSGRTGANHKHPNLHSPIFGSAALTAVSGFG